MYQPPEQRSPLPPPDLVRASFFFYLQEFRPLFLTAAAAAAIPTLLGLAVQPEQTSLLFLWTTLLLAVELAAHSAVLWAAACRKDGGAVTPASAFMAAVAFGPRYFAASFLLLALVLFSGWTILLIPLAVFVVVRTSLYGPAIVLENRNIVDAFQRSWRLIEGRWWRTCLMELAVISWALLASLLLLLLAQGEPGVFLLFVANVVVTALVVPFIMCFFVLLFEDYRRVSDHTPSPRDIERQG